MPSVPLATKPLIVRVKNTYAYPIKVPVLKTTLAAATTRPGCVATRANLLVSRSGGAITVKPRKTAAVVMTVVMPGTVADACQGATFALTFTARAVRA